MIACMRQKKPVPLYSFIVFKYVILIIRKENKFWEYLFIFLGIWGEAELFLGIWGAKAKYFWGDEMIIFRDLGRSMYSFQG